VNIKTGEKKEMKIRQGLVSNSSSSSFLLFLDEIPKTKEDVKEILFPYKETFENPYDGYRLGKAPKSWPTIIVSEIIFNDIHKTRNIRKKVVKRIIENSYYDAISVHPENLISDIKKGLFDHKFVIKLNYSDNDGPLYCAIEQGNTFYEIPHIRIDKH
jgi:hypothetical protein